MSRPRLLAAVALVAALSFPRPARAGGTGMEGLEVLAYLAAALVVVDVGFATYDVVQAARGQLPSKGVCVAETLVAGPQVLAGVSLMREGSSSTLPAAVAFTSFTGTLTLHGIWGFAVASPRDSASDAQAGSGAAKASGFGLRLGGAF